MDFDKLQKKTSISNLKGLKCFDGKTPVSNYKKKRTYIFCKFSYE